MIHLTPQNPEPDPFADALVNAGQLANVAAAQRVFAEYHETQSPQTLRRHQAGLVAFAEFLALAGKVVSRGGVVVRCPDCGHTLEAGLELPRFCAGCQPSLPTRWTLPEGVSLPDLQHTPAAWSDITWGLVKAFKHHLMDLGYAVNTVNARLSTVKKYAELAMQAGALPETEYRLMQTVRGYRRTEGKRANEKRAVTRRGAKKSEAVTLTEAQIEHLFAACGNTPQGARDQVLLALFFEHGLRVGEIAALTVSAIQWDDHEIVFYRPKVDKVQRHRLTPISRAALLVYRPYLLAEADAPLLRASRKSGRLLATGMSERAITARMNDLGRRIGVVGLSAHDGRHSWATRAARNKTDVFSLQEAGGWSSLATPRRYVEAAAIANEGVKLR